MSASATQDDRRRVLFLVGQVGYGGSEGQLRLLAEHLDQSAWETHVVVFHSSPNADYADELSEAGIGISVMPHSVQSPLGKLGFATRTARQIRPHVIHSWTVHDNPYAALAGRLSGTRVRWGSLRGSTTLPGFRSLPRWYRRLALRSIQRLVVNSQALADELQGLGISNGRIVVLPNCVEPDPSSRRNARVEGLEALGFDRSQRVIGSVGNIRRAKNQILFVRAMATVVTQHPDVRGLIIGETLDGEEVTRAEIEREIQNLGLDGKVVLVGFRSDVRSLMAGMAALCMTSDTESMPNVVLEAMAERVPVVATAVGGVPEVVVNGATGYLVTPGDERGVAEAMGRVLGMPDEACRLTAAAYELVTRERSCCAVAHQLSSAYLDALRRVGAL